MYQTYNKQIEAGLLKYKNRETIMYDELHHFPTHPVTLTPWLYYVKANGFNNPKTSRRGLILPVHSLKMYQYFFVSYFRVNTLTKNSTYTWWVLKWLNLYSQYSHIKTQTCILISDELKVWLECEILCASRCRSHIFWVWGGSHDIILSTLRFTLS